MKLYYFIDKDRERQGPFSLEDIRAYNITPTTLVWTKGMEKWMKAKDVADFHDIIHSQVTNEIASEQQNLSGNSGGGSILVLIQKADQGDVNAQLELGRTYFEGKVVPLSLEEADKWFRMAAEQGSAEGQCHLGLLNLLTNLADDKVTQVSEETVKWLRMAAEQGYKKAEDFLTLIEKFNQGDVDAQFQLGDCFLAGRDVRQSPMLAANCFRIAANLDSAKAQDALGNLYSLGYGVPQSDEMAVKWFRLASNQGYTDAHCHLGSCYEKGKGVPQSDEMAVKLYRMAAEQGDAHGQFCLGYFCYLGKGIQKSKSEALKWLRMAVDQGDEQAMEAIQMITGSNQKISSAKNEAIKQADNAEEKADTKIVTAPRTEKRGKNKSSRVFYVVALIAVAVCLGGYFLNTNKENSDMDIEETSRTKADESQTENEMVVDEKQPEEDSEPKITQGLTDATKRYEQLGNFSDGLASVGKQENGNWVYGYINTHGDEIVPLIYDETKEFINGVAPVRKNDKWGLIDKNGKVIADFKYDILFGEMSEGLIPFGAKDGDSYKCGYVNRKGDEAIPFVYSSVESDYGGYISPSIFRHGLAIAEKDGKLGYINTKGEMVIENKYTYATEFLGNEAKVQEGDVEMLIDTKGNLVYQADGTIDILGWFEDGIAPVGLDSGYGFLKRNGEIVRLDEKIFFDFDTDLGFWGNANELFEPKDGKVELFYGECNPETAKYVDIDYDGNIIELKETVSERSSQENEFGKKIRSKNYIPEGHRVCIEDYGKDGNLGIDFIPVKLVNQKDQYLSLVVNDNAEILFYTTGINIASQSKNNSGIYSVGAFSPDGYVNGYMDKHGNTTIPLLNTYLFYTYLRNQRFVETTEKKDVITFDGNYLISSNSVTNKNSKLKLLNLDDKSFTNDGDVATFTIQNMEMADLGLTVRLKCKVTKSAHRLEFIDSDGEVLTYE